MTMTQKSILVRGRRYGAHVLRKAVERLPVAVHERLSFARHAPAIEAARQRGDLRLHLGSGHTILPGWINVDMLVRPDVLTMRLPQGLEKFEDGSVRYVYTAHFLEHIGYPEEALEFVRQCYRILMPGGILRIVVPGIEKIIHAYADDREAFFEVQRQMHPPWCTTKLEHLMYALQQDGEHKYGYDFETMDKLLRRAGFTTVVDSDYNQSRDENLRIDYRARTDDAGNYLSLYVEAVK